MLEVKFLALLLDPAWVMLDQHAGDGHLLQVVVDPSDEEFLRGESPEGLSSLPGVEEVHQPGHLGAPGHPPSHLQYSGLSP